MCSNHNFSLIHRNKIGKPLRNPGPAPVLVKDSPSSDNESDTENIKCPTTEPDHLNGKMRESGRRLRPHQNNYHTGSSGNFGNITARSAPCTPQGLQVTSPPNFTDSSSQSGISPSSTGPPSIHRSPSHVFSKTDKGSIKQLSSSTPAMTAQARTPEPPSPKATTTKAEKLPTTSKSRQKKFHRHFPAVDLDEKVLNYYSCALIGDILLQGHLYITKNYFAFYSNVFGYITKLLIPLLTVEKITKERTAKIIPNAVGIETNEDKHVFGSLMSRDNTFRLMIKVWDAARNSALQNSLNVEAELLAASVPSECSDSSKSSESGNESGVADSGNATFETMTGGTRIKRIPPLTPAKVLKSENMDSRKSSSAFSLYRMSTQTLLLSISTFILLFLFLSASVLLYRIGKVQNKFNYAYQENFVVSENKDVYSELLQWQAQLHSKSAGAVYNFLDANLDQLAKVRQSLEALSSLLVIESNNANKSSKPNPPKETSTKETLNNS